MSTELRHQRDENGIVTLRLASPGRAVVVLDTWLIGQLHAFFDGLDDEVLPRGFILMSDSDRVFVAGADLVEINELDDDGLHAYLRDAAAAFGRIAALHCPSAACINGAALGGGLEIAMHCDALIAYLPGEGEKPYRVGLPEAGLGLCPGWGGTQMLPARLEPGRAIELTATGTTPKVHEIADLFTATVDSPSDLRDAALNWISQHDSEESQRSTPVSIDGSNADRIAAGLDAVRNKLPDTPAAAAVVEAVETGLERGWEAAIAKERELLVALRHTEIARTKLEAFFAGAR